VPEPPTEPEKTPAKANTQGLVAKQVLPTVSPGARHGIRGTVEVIIRVSVNEDGAVSNAAYVSPGPGNYFARLAQRAALSWEFTPPKRNGNPERSFWTVRFQFGRETTEADATEESASRQ
jgi:TonB family protein